VVARAQLPITVVQAASIYVQNNATLLLPGERLPRCA
jgi:hypothetical protein